MNIVSMMDLLMFDQTRSYKNLENLGNRYKISALTATIDSFILHSFFKAPFPESVQQLCSLGAVLKLCLSKDK